MRVGLFLAFYVHGLKAVAIDSIVLESFDCIIEYRLPSFNILPGNIIRNWANFLYRSYAQFISFTCFSPPLLFVFCNLTFMMFIASVFMHVIHFQKDAPHGHAEMLFDEVRVPVENMLLGEGRGFEIAQGRLGPGRIHHCMRLIGMAERALDLMVQRTTQRVAFGKPIAEQGTIKADIALSRVEIDQTRLLCLDAAKAMDDGGNKLAKDQIAAIKIAAPAMAKRVIDRAMQSHGGMGLSQDTPLAHMWTWARTLQLVRRSH